MTVSSLGSPFFFLVRAHQGAMYQFHIGIHVQPPPLCLGIQTPQCEVWIAELCQVFVCYSSFTPGTDIPNVGRTGSDFAFTLHGDISVKAMSAKNGGLLFHSCVRALDGWRDGATPLPITDFKSSKGRIHAVFRHSSLPIPTVDQKR
ncbi:hypothetical protein CC2G_004893 [Coprinopsis cinerea AmutBmut pab1-1]|nr:hypothetical protein CC2G_004893 [Coprinopsis cinerea AmutBmut pab1-1]